MELNNVKAIVIQTRRHSENNLMLVCITRELGKIFISAPHATQISSKLRSFCQVLTSGNISLQQSKVDSNLYYLLQAVNSNAYANIKKNELKLASASYITSLAANLIEFGQKDENIYRLLLGFLEALDLIDESNKINFLHIVLVTRLLASTGFGYFPEWCMKCDSVLEKDFYYNKNKGVFLCDKCKDINSIYIDKQAFSQWKMLLEYNLTNNNWVELSKELVSVVEDYVRITLGKEINGREYLRLIRGF